MFDLIVGMDAETACVFSGLLFIGAICVLLCIRIARTAPVDTPICPPLHKKDGPRYFDKLEHKEPIEPTEELRQSYQSDKGNLQATEATMDEFISIQNIYDLPTPRGVNGHQQHADMLCAAIDEQAKKRAARMVIDALHPAGRRV